MNRWNRIHHGIGRVYTGILILFALLIVAAVVGIRDLPAWLLGGAGATLLALCVSWPILHFLVIYARQRMDPAPRRSGEATCAFCGRRQEDLQFLIAGPEQYVCGDCIHEASAVLPTRQAAPAGGVTVRCSFCRTERPVGELLVRGGAAICGECAVAGMRALPEGVDS